VLAAGAISTNLVVKPLPDTLAEGDESVTLTVQAAAAYTLTALSNSTVTLRDRPLDQWRHAQFTPEELLLPGVSGDSADPDGDGLLNCVECTLGLPPKLADTTTRPTAHIENGELHYTFTHNPEATDMATEVQTSTDLLNWLSGPGQVERIACEDFGELRLETWRAVAPVASSQTRYLRLSVLRL
jgi:hypothetical protein